MPQKDSKISKKLFSNGSIYRKITSHFSFTRFFHFFCCLLTQINDNIYAITIKPLFLLPSVSVKNYIELNYIFQQGELNSSFHEI